MLSITDHREPSDMQCNVVLAFAVLVAQTLLFVAPRALAAEAYDAHQYFFNLNIGDLRAEAQDAKKAGKKAIFIMFEQEGCPGCLHMKQHVLNRPDVQKFFRERFINLS